MVRFSDHVGTAPATTTLPRSSHWTVMLATCSGQAAPQRCMIAGPAAFAGAARIRRGGGWGGREGGVGVWGLGGGRTAGGAGSAAGFLIRNRLLTELGSPRESRIDAVDEIAGDDSLGIRPGDALMKVILVDVDDLDP